MTGAADACYREAREAWKAGLSPVPCGRPKQPVTAWKDKQRRRPTADELREWYPGRDSLGIVCGPKPDDPDPQVAARPGVECIDFDDRDVYDAVKAEAEHVGLADDIAQIEAGYCDDTPGGGVRWLYRCDEVPGNLKLAQRLDAEGRPQVVIETRGAGGFCVVAPSGASAHPSGKPYVRRAGGFPTIVTLSVPKRAQIIAFLMSFDSITKTPTTSSPSATSSDGTRPGDAFNARTTWPELLEPRGWRALYTRRDGVTCWRRPGKDSPGLSATTGHGGADLLYVFTSSSVFDAGRSYDRFGAYAVLEHGGDFTAAARALAGRESGARPGADDKGDDDGHDDEQLDDRKRPSMATQIVELVCGAGVELWHEADTGDAFLQVKEGEHVETYPLRSRTARDWLARLAFVRLGKVPNAQAVTDAIGTLAGKAQWEGAARVVHIRVAAHEDHVYVDLCDPEWRVLDIGPTGWTVTQTAPVYFRRSRNARPLPAPKPGGTLDALRALLNVEDDRAWHLMVGWLVGALKPHGPYSVLALTGEQGTAKTTAARMLRRCIDPFKVLLQGAVRNFDDLAVSLRHQHVLGIDNLSSISEGVSDELARIATGGGTTKRQLFTDDELHVTDVCRPIVLTSIPLCIDRPDLADRAIVVRCPVISDERRRPEAELWAAFDAIHAHVLGALADAVSSALRTHRDVRLPRLPRMADHVQWVTAAAPALGWQTDTYVNAFTHQQHEVVAQQVEDDVLAPHVLALVPEVGDEWTGTTASMLKTLTPEKPPKEWPKNPKALSTALRRLAPSARRLGVSLTPPDRAVRDRVWTVARTTGTTGTTGTEEEISQENGESCGACPGACPEPSPPTGTEQAPNRHRANVPRGKHLRSVGAGGAGGAGLPASVPSVGGDGLDDEGGDHAANF